MGVARPEPRPHVPEQKHCRLALPAGGFPQGRYAGDGFAVLISVTLMTSGVSQHASLSLRLFLYALGEAPGLLLRGKAGGQGQAHGLFS